MTYITRKNEINEWIAGFFYSSWPSEDRFDEWKDHKIIVMNDNTLYSKLCKKIPKFLKNKRD